MNYETGEVYFAQKAREELMLENQFLTTTTNMVKWGWMYTKCKLEMIWWLLVNIFLRLQS